MFRHMLVYLRHHECTVSQAARAGLIFLRAHPTEGHAAYRISGMHTTLPHNPEPALW